MNYLIINIPVALDEHATAADRAMFVREMRDEVRAWAQGTVREFTEREQVSRDGLIVETPAKLAADLVPECAICGWPQGRGCDCGVHALAAIQDFVVRRASALNDSVMTAKEIGEGHPAESVERAHWYQRAADQMHGALALDQVADMLRQYVKKGGGA